MYEIIIVVNCILAVIVLIFIFAMKSKLKEIDRTVGIAEMKTIKLMASMEIN